MAKRKTIKRPNPGSDAARKLGCKCPVMDNGHGKGYMGLKDVFVYSGECPLHAAIVEASHGRRDSL